MHVLNDLVEMDMGTLRVRKLIQNGDKPLNRYAGALHSLPYTISINYAFNPTKASQGV